MHICFVFDDIILEHQPLGATYISSVLKQHGHTVSSINIDETEDCAEAVRQLDPQLLCFSVATSQAPRYQEVNAEIKRALPEIHTLFGGPHPSYFPQVLEMDKSIDSICLGEGEYPTLELADAMEAGKDYTEISNLHFRINGDIKKNPNRPFLSKEELSKMPFPDRDLMRPYQIWHSPIGFMMAGRGCPYDCTFCFNHVSRNLQDGKWTRQRTAESVVEEVKWLRDRYGVIYVAFQDDTFILNRRWLREFCPLYAKEVGLPFICNIRADLTDEELADLLAQAGCIRVAMGIESGDDEIRKTILAKNMTSDQIIRACDLLYDRNIKVVGQNMIGVPGETVETALSTIELNIRCRVHVNTFSFFAPFPGTKLGEIAKEQGFSGNLSEIPREFQDSLTSSLFLKDKEIIEKIGHCAHLFVSYPALFQMVKTLLKVLPADYPKIKLLQVMSKIKEQAMKWNGGRLPRHWHQPRFVEEKLIEGLRNREQTPICEHVSSDYVMMPNAT